MKRLMVLLLVVFACVALAPKPALADASSARTDGLGVAPIFDVQVAPFAAPSPAHPWGTVALAWYERTSDAGVDLRVGEWDLGAGQMLRAHVLRSETGLRAVRLARTTTSLFLLSADPMANGPAEVLRLDAGLRVRDRLFVGNGWLASLVADDRFVATGIFEQGGGYSVQLIDTATLAIVTTRVLKGNETLSPWPVPARSSHALRLEEGRLYVSLPDRDPRVLALRLPSLATDASMTFPVPNEHRWAYRSVWIDPVGSPLGFETADDGHVLLAPDLSSYRVTRSVSVPAWAPAIPETTGERASTRAFGRTVMTGVSADTWAIAVGR